MKAQILICNRCKHQFLDIDGIDCPKCISKSKIAALEFRIKELEDNEAAVAADNHNLDQENIRLKKLIQFAIDESYWSFEDEWVKTELEEQTYVGRD